MDALLAEAGWLRELARSLVDDPAAADDIVQQTWLAALRRPPAVDRSLRPWLRAVAENFARMRRRGEGARAQRERATAREEATSEDVELVDRVETQRFLAREVLKLDEPFRSAVVLRYYEGLTSERIAERVGSNENTVRWRIKRGLELLRERLDRRHGGDRRAWLSLLTPLYVARDLAAPQGAAAGVGKSAWTARAAFVAAAGVAAISVGAWRLFSRGAAHSTEGAAVVSSATATPVEGPDVRGAQRSQVEPPQRELAEVVAVVAGRCIDERGAPAVGVLVQARSRSGGELLAAGASDAVGAFSLEFDELSRARASDVLAFGGEGFLAGEHHAPVDLLPLVELGDVVVRREARVEGVVLDELGRSIAGARVAAEPIGARWPAEREPPLEEARLLGSLLDDGAPNATSDEFGRFELRGLSEGYVRLWATADARECAWSEPIALLGGDTARAPAFVLAPLAADRAIAGRVVDARGAPVAGAEVEAARSSLRRAFFERRAGVVRTFTDSSGRFELVAEPGNRYDLAARFEGRLATLEWSVGAAGPAELVLREPREMLVVLRGQPGSVDGAWAVRVDELSGARTSLAATVRSPSEIAVAVDHWRAFHLELRVGDRVAATRAIEPDAAPASIEVELSPLPRVEVFVTEGGAPLEGALVELIGAAASSDDANVLDSARADADGRAMLHAPFATSAHLRVAADGRASALRGPVALDADRTEEVELTPGGTLSGRVTDERGSRVAGARVELVRADGVRSTRCDAQGEYRIERLEPGEWSARLAPLPGRVDETSSPRAGAAAPSRAWIVDGADTRLDLRFEGSPACRLSGIVTLDGEALGACVVELARAGRPRVLARSWSDPRGRFALAVDAPGEHELRVDSIGRGRSRFELRERVVLTEGETSFGWAERSAQLVLEPLEAQAPFEVRVRCATPGGGEFALWGRSDDGAPLALRVPARELAIEALDRPWRAAKLELQPGERRTVKFAPR